ncbi:MAG: Nramp family divalent metal transporter [Saprospiraceae bacterium]|nr:Nramp family divalent metal transporter [Saprospiraceae bacterium]
MTKDPYLISESTIKEPPQRFIDRLKFLGPGFILSASIVGSGELIATTILGAKAGFAAFWIILLSCLIKVAVQLQYGKHAIWTGETTMKSFNLLPGIRIGQGSWALWIVFILTFFKIIQLGGMVGGASIVLHMLFPAASVFNWSLIVALSAGILIYKNYYPLVEKGSLVLIGFFTLLTLGSLYLLKETPYAFTWIEVWEKLRFNLPPDYILVAIGAFGITGVAADETIAYNYWCIEKGYAAYCGPKTNGVSDAARKTRAEGWVKVMYTDAIVAMVLYTIVTAAFYLLGAAILFKRGEIPEGNALIEKIALIYTESLGPDVKTAYLAGAFFVLYSSVFASLAAWTRIFSDIFGQLGWINFSDLNQRKTAVAVLAFVFPVLWVLMYYTLNSPVLMILSGGVIGSFLLLLVGYGAIHFRYFRKSESKPSVAFDVFFWLSLSSILFVALYGLYSFL